MSISLKLGKILKINNEEFLIQEYQDTKNLILRRLKDNKLFIFSLEELMNKIGDDKDNSQATCVASKIPYDEKLYEIAINRYNIIKNLLNKTPTRREIEECAQQNGLHVATIYRWIKDYKKTGNVYGLIPNYKKRGCRKLRLEPDIENLIENKIKNLYLTKQKLSARVIYEEVKRECLSRNYKVPHYNTILKKIKILNPILVKETREGHLAARTVSPLRGEFQATAPLEILQVDHTLLDIIVVDPIYRKPIGRPNITVIIDIYSRMIFGFYLSLEPPSFFTFGQAFYIGVAPKYPYLRKFGIEGDWPILGLPKNIFIHSDNAKEFRGKDIEWFLQAYNIHQEFRPKKKPYFGGHIERFFKTLNEELHRLPGTTFSNPKQKGEYDSEKNAVYTIDELEKYIVEWIVNVYHQKKHEGIGMPPIEKYKRGIVGDDRHPGIGLPDILTPEELEHLRISLLYTEERTINRNGVQINYVTYWHEIFTNLIGRKEKFIFKVDPRNVSYIYFLHPELKIYYKIPCKNLAFPPMSQWELKEVTKQLVKENNKNINEFEIIKAYERLKTITEESASKSKKARRSFARKINQQDKKELNKIILKEVKKTSMIEETNTQETDEKKINYEEKDYKVEVMEW
ncbi:MAG: Mu transposase C-terminal domain-containing protein [Candidatus Aenigmatarchaeota archaeon]